MTDRKPAVATLYALSVRSAYIKSERSTGVNLGELRSIVQAAEGLDDASRVSFEKIDIDYIRRGEHTAEIVHIREEKKA